MKNKRLIKIISLLALVTLMISQITVSTFAESKDGMNDIASVTAEETDGATVETKEKSDSVSEETSNIAADSETKQVPSAQTESPAAPAQKAAKGSATFAKKAAAKAKDVPETANTVKPGMTQAEIQKIVDANDTVVFEGGTYKDISITTNKTTTFEINDKNNIVEFEYSGAPSKAPYAFQQNGGNLNFHFSNNAQLKITGYGAGIYQNEAAKDVELNIIGFGLLEITKSHDSNTGSSSGMFLHSKGTKLLKIKGISNDQRMTVRCNENGASGIDWYPQIEDKANELKFTCQYANLYTNKNGYNGINFQTDNGTERNHNGMRVDIQDSYLASCGNTGGSGVMNDWGKKSYDDHDSFWNITRSTLLLNNNLLDGFSSGKLTLNESNITANENSRGGIAGVSLDAYNSEITVNGNYPTLDNGKLSYYGGLWVHTIIGQPENDFYSHIINTTINAKDNGACGVMFYPSKDTNYSVVPYIQNSTITSENNKYAGAYFRNGGIVKENSQLITKGNFIAGIYNANGKLSVKNSFTSCTEEQAQGLYHANNDEIIIDNETVARLEAADKEAHIKPGVALNMKDTYVLNGSLQASLPNMTGTYGNAWNLQKGADEVYAAPINQFKTKLVRFDLHKDINKECAKDTNTFKTYDPNKKEAYDYSFRYNKKGEDLNADASGNAYVWTPASILNYDATEGTIDQTGTAGEVTYGSSATSKGDAAKGKRFTSDITIFGNSLDLAEKTMPTAVKDGLVFLGWYYADDEEKAAEYAAKEDFINLYDLLNTEFTSSSKVTEGKSDDPAKGVEKKTIYAKWMTEEQYYRAGQIAIEKKVTEKGQPYQVNTTFYAGLFEDAGCTVPTTDADGKAIVIPLNLGGGDTVTVTQDDIPLGTHYVAETDKDGKVVRSSEGHSVKIDNAEVKIETDAPAVKVTIINDYGDYEGYYKEEGGDPGTTVTSSNTTTTTTEEDGAGETVKGNATQTGDDSSMAPYIAILILAAAIAAAIVVTGRRKKNKK